MAYTYEDVIPTLIANTTMQKRLLNGVHRTYLIKANDGYVLHDNTGNWTETDPITGEEVVKKAYYTGTVTCAASYDFVTNPRGFEAVLENEVPSDQIFGKVDNDPEVM